MPALLAALLWLFLTAGAGAEPKAHWQNALPAPSADVARAVESHGRAQRPTTVMVVRDDRVIASWGDVSQRVNVRSVRKSFLSTLYGLAVAEGKIDLSSTLAQLGINDKEPGLTAMETQASVRDLLAARSGIYHRAAYETAQMRRNRPARGSHAPGTFWFYNNWDFNALGTIYRKATGEDIFQSFARRIAKPTGMEDFSARDGRYIFAASSIHPAYTFSMSARDMARFGLLFRNDGRWDGTQIIPAAWIKESTTAFSQTERGKLGYGYLWWVLPAQEWGPGAVMASGYGGQMIAVVPSKRLVVAQTVDPRQNDKGIRTSVFIDFLRRIALALPD